jgi:hypothetical protein
MKVLKGWKTLTFNILAITVMQWDDVRHGILSLFGGWEYAVSVLATMNIILRVITVGPVAMMWISKEEQDGIQSLEKKP